MTELQAYAIKDIQTKLFTNPHFMTNEIIAKRAFENACKNPESNFNQYPSDYSLYHVGSYNIESGKMTSTTPSQIANATEYVTDK